MTVEQLLFSVIDKKNHDSRITSTHNYHILNSEPGQTFRLELLAKKANELSYLLAIAILENFTEDVLQKSSCGK